MTHNISHAPPPAPLPWTQRDQATRERWETRGYWRLIRSLHAEELLALEEAIQEKNEDAAKRLAASLEDLRGAVREAKEARNVIITAHKACRLGLITVEQLATLHIYDAALRELVTHITVFESVENDDGVPARKISYRYDLPIFDDSLLKFSLDRENMHKKEEKGCHYLRTFFNFDDKEWEVFCSILMDSSVPSSERNFYMLPIFFWYPMVSRITARIQEILAVFQTIVIEKDPERSSEYLPAPSFTMLNAFLKAKASKCNRRAPEFVPTYNLLAADDYASLKSVERIAIALYFPGSSPDRYSYKDIHFEKLIDGYENVGPYSAILHDGFHGAKENGMKEGVIEGRFRLALVAKNHPFDKKDFDSPSISNELIDGDLICSYEKEQDSTIRIREAKAQKFGEIFLILKDVLHPELRRAFIQDMVINFDEIGLGRQDLLEEDQEVYDQMKTIIEFNITNYLPT